MGCGLDSTGLEISTEIMILKAFAQLLPYPKGSQLYRCLEFLALNLPRAACPAVLKGWVSPQEQSIAPWVWASPDQMWGCCPGELSLFHRVMKWLGLEGISIAHCVISGLDRLPWHSLCSLFGEMERLPTPEELVASLWRWIWTTLGLGLHLGEPLEHQKIFCAGLQNKTWRIICQNGEKD